MYFTIKDLGCWASGGFGHQHIREQMAFFLTSLYKDNEEYEDQWKNISEIVKALEGEMSDDVWEEYEALDWLNKQCSEDCYFTFHDGDLMLAETEESIEGEED